nr:hypothetical protein [Pedobacter panaciterrae]
MNARTRPLGFVLLFVLLAVFSFTAANGQQLKLKISGSPADGYYVDIYRDDQLIVTQDAEFSLQISNLDLSANATIDGWKGEKWEGDAQKITLTKESYIADFDAKLAVSVTYEVLNQNTIKKKITLIQPSMPSMYYSITEKAKPAAKPLKYVTFEHDNFPGGLVHEMFPAAGFVTDNNLVVGFLTDAGYLNEYTRTTRRRFNGRGHGFVGMRKLPDPELMSIADSKEQAFGQHYIKQTFGEMYNLDAGTERVLELPAAYQKNDSIDVQSGITFIAPLKDQKVYTISFLSKGTLPLALKLFRIKNGKKTVELENGVKYIDDFTAVNNQWTLFKGSIFLPYIEHDSVSLFIGNTSQKKGGLFIKDLKIVAHQPAVEPYNVLPLGEKREKTTFIFIEPWKSHRDFMISAQERLAEGKGFRGSQIEKMLYANFNMLTWINSVNDMAPFNVPNMNYSPDMYNRDSFWSTVATYNKDLNLKLWDQWGKTQTPQGVIGTIITPYMGSVEAKDNEATITWLIWAMLNKKRFGAKLPEDKIRKAVDFVLREFDEDRDGLCRSHFSLSQVDIIDYTPKTDRLAVNQGMLAIALRTIKELGYTEVTEEYIQKAEEGYRAFYDTKRKHLLFDRNFPDIISLTDLEPEFLSLWLFKKPILTDEMVINHLEQTPVLNKVSNSPHPEFGTTAPVCVRLTKDKKGYSYLNSDYQPFAEFGVANYKNGAQDGYYYNGGSWMRAEYCAYVAGLKHGWKKAPMLMENRVWAEINLNPEWPFSKEFIPTKWSTTASWWPSTKGLCWNVFILMANEVAGLRTPDMDPDYKENK